MDVTLKIPFYISVVGISYC